MNEPYEFRDFLHDVEDIVDELPTWMAKRMTELHISQRQLAQKVGLDHAAISRLMSGKYQRPPNATVTLRIIRELYL